MSFTISHSAPVRQNPAGTVGFAAAAAAHLAFPGSNGAMGMGTIDPTLAVINPAFLPLGPGDSQWDLPVQQALAGQHTGPVPDVALGIPGLIRDSFVGANALDASDPEFAAFIATSMQQIQPSPAARSQEYGSNQFRLDRCCSAAEPDFGMGMQYPLPDPAAPSQDYEWHQFVFDDRDTAFKPVDGTEMQYLQSEPGSETSPVGHQLALLDGPLPAPEAAVEPVPQLTALLALPNAPERQYLQPEPVAGMSPVCLQLPLLDEPFPAPWAAVEPVPQPTAPLASPNAPERPVFGRDHLSPSQLVAGKEKYVPKNPVGPQKHPAKKRKREDDEPEPEPLPKPAPKNPKRQGAKTGWYPILRQHVRRCRDPNAGCDNSCDMAAEFPKKYAELSTKACTEVPYLKAHLRVQLWRHIPPPAI